MSLLSNLIRRQVDEWNLIPRIKPDGHKRKPITGTGLSSYMDKHGIENPVDFAKVYLTTKGKDYKIKGHINLRFTCEQMNVTVEEALLYICEGILITSHVGENID